MRNNPIGVFDSGVGGLTVVRELMRELPGERIVYFGDTARVPYGTKSKATVIKFSIENILFLLRFNVKLVVVACNTSSCLSLPVLKRHFNIPVLGVIMPGAEEAAARSKNGRIGVIGTRATITSGVYENAIKRINSGAKVLSLSCPLFVPLAEEGWTRERITMDVARVYLRPLIQNKVDTLILGCTHYPLLKGVIKRVLGKEVVLIDSARQTAKRAKQILHQNNLTLKAKSDPPAHRFYVSDEPERFAKLGMRFLGRRIDSVKKANEYV